MRPRRIQGGIPRALLAFIALSLSLRLVSAVYQGNEPEILPGVYDQVSYHVLATRVLDGHGFSFPTGWWPATRSGQPTAHWSFLYTLYLAFIYSVLGENPIAARLLQAVMVGVVHPWLSWRIGKVLFGQAAGIVAAFLCAVYGYFVYYAGALMTEALYVVAILWSLDIAIRLARESDESETRWSSWLLLGTALGAAVLLRQVYLLFVPVLLVWLVWVRRVEGRSSPGRTIKGMALACSVLAVAILPWTIRNHQAFGQFVLLNTNAGFAFFWGNHPIHGHRFIPILPPEGEDSYLSLIPAKYEKLDEASLDRALLCEGVAFVLSDPGRYLSLTLTRALEYFKFWPSRESSPASNLVRVASFGFLFPFALLGLGIAGRLALNCCPRRQARATGFERAGILLLILFVSFYSTIHLLSWALIRYRMPVDGILLIFAGVGIVWLAERLPMVKLPRTIEGPH